jgi:hypothetical protein
MKILRMLAMTTLRMTSRTLRAVGEPVLSIPTAISGLEKVVSNSRT